MDLELVGTTLADRYLIQERIGSGATGEVYRARHVKIGKSFAVKVLHSRLLSDPKIRKRFDREAELGGTLKHPNIIGVVDVGETADGLGYLVMELAVGEPLSIAIASGPMPAPRAIAILRQLCDALHHAHDRGLVHRDFKPDNIIIERRPDGTDFVRIIDFGIAILRDDLSSSDNSRLTTSGVVLGTPQYLAPEQAFGSGDHRIDLFALGVVSYELLTGRLPFDGEGAEIARANLTTATPPMGVRVPFLDVDPLLEAFTLRLMSKSPELRPETGKEAREILDLIERDRDAAAELLGIDSTTLARRMVGRTEESQPAQRVSIGDTFESQPVARERIDTDLSISIAPVARARSIAPPTPPRSRRGLVIGGTAAAAIAIGAIVIGTSGSSPTTSVPIAMTPDAAPERPPAAPTPPAPVPQVPVPDPTPTIVPAPVKPAIVPTPIKPTPPKPQPPKPKPKPPEPPADPTPQQLADLYVAVGRDLKAYSDKKGVNAEALSHRYRLIKIADALATGDRRRTTAQTLKEIRAAAR